jgi:2,5-diamino-6-(ribosylamino)-4(3H)-pyrimidinone 5'-phosphate reductase
MQRPHVFVNVALTADGKIDTLARKGATISSTADKERGDCLRASVDAVMVGGWMFLNEDPSLTIKPPELRAQRIRLGSPENPAKVGVVTVANLKGDGHFMTTGRRCIVSLLAISRPQKRSAN